MQGARGAQQMPHPLIIGIAGGSAAGKSTLTLALVDTLRQQSAHRVAMITSDHYLNSIHPCAPTFVYSTTGERLFNADHPDAIEWEALLRDLDALLAREDAPDIVFLEGHLILHEPSVRARMHIRLFVDLDADERVLRRLLRDIHSGRVNPDPMFIANYYRECARVGHAQYIEPSRVHADLIVRGDADWQRLRPLLLAMIAAQLADR
jgi:uridine kinase